MEEMVWDVSEAQSARGVCFFQVEKRVRKFWVAHNAGVCVGFESNMRACAYECVWEM